MAIPKYDINGDCIAGITLREHFDDKFVEHRVVDDARFKGLEDQLNFKISSLDKATTVAAGLMEKRLESMNEFRAQLKDQAGTFVPRLEYESQQHRVDEDVRVLRETKASSEVSAAMLEKRLESMNEFRLQLKDQAGTFYTKGEHEVYMSSVEKDLRMLRESKATLEGKASQTSVTVALIISGLGLIAGLVSTFKPLFK
jgi:predicted sugar kinase